MKLLNIIKTKRVQKKNTLAIFWWGSLTLLDLFVYVLCVVMNDPDATIFSLFMLSAVIFFFLDIEENQKTIVVTKETIARRLEY